MNLILSVIEIKDFHDKTPEDRDFRELLLIRAGEVLRSEFPAPAMIGRLDRWRFGLITAGLTDTGVENLLSRAVAQIEDAATRGPQQAATVSFSSAELYPEDNLEELLSDAVLVLP